MKYNLDLASLSVHQYKEILKKQNLLPSRRILLQHLDENFQLLENMNISTISQLGKSLSSPQKISSFAATSGIPEAYLVILRREIHSLVQKPVPLSSFPDIASSVLQKLHDEGIDNSKDYFESNRVEGDELSGLSDLVRINGVGPVAAKAFYEAGYKSVSDVAHAEAASLLGRVSDVNEARHYYKANLGIKDMQFCIDFARLLLDLCS